MRTKLPDLIKETVQKMIDSKKYINYRTIQTTLITFLDNFSAGDHACTDITKRFFEMLEAGLWEAISANGTLPHHRRELMWTKFHWFRTNKNTVAQGVDFLHQFCTDTEHCILRQVFQSIIMQLVVTAAKFMVHKDEAQAIEEPEVLETLHEDEQAVLRYVAGATIHKLTGKFAGRGDNKSAAFTATLDGMVTSKDNSQAYLASSLAWTDMQNRGGLKFVSDPCFLMFRHIHRLGASTLTVKQISSFKGGDLRTDLKQKLSNHNLIKKYWTELTPDLNQHWREELFSAVIKLYIVIYCHNTVEKYKQNEQIKANSLLKEQKALRKSLKDAHDNLKQ